MPVISLAVVTNGPAATAGSTPIRFKTMGMTVAMLVETKRRNERHAHDHPEEHLVP